MKFRHLLLIITVLCCIQSCKDDDQNLNEIGEVSFSSTELIEVENATIPLGVNIAIDNYNHSGGTIEVLITGANYGVDYETSEGSDTFIIEVSPQALVTTFTISPLDNDVLEGNKNLIITLTNTSGALELGEAATLSFTILDNDDPSVALVSFENTALQVEENNANSTVVQIPFDQATTNGGTITVLSSGDAIFGTDFTINGESSANFTLNVPEGATSASFEIQPIDNTVFEADKMAIFTIDEVTGGLLIGVNQQTTATIVNDDLPPNPVIDFDSSNTLVYNEDIGTLTLNFVLSGATTADATIEITTSGSADASDFSFAGSNANPYTFIIPAGSTFSTLDITLIDDIETEFEETIVLEITSITGGLDAGLNTQTQTLSILDNDSVEPFNYVQTFETTTDLSSIGFNAFLLPAQDLPSSKLFKYNMNSGKYSDVDDVTLTSDSGLVVFYNATQNGNGIIDNIVTSPLMDVTGDINVSIDIAFSQAPAVNNALVTFYYSETYDNSGIWSASDWIVMGTETAADMTAIDGLGTNDYKRKVMNITTNASFYVAVRVNQTIDDTFTKTQWRLDNFKINNN